MINSESEIWKSHPDIEGMEVSTLGNVRTLDKLGSRENRTYSKKGHVLKQSHNGCGYLQVSIQIDGKQNKKSVHRLVAQTFLPNPNCLPMVNHRDCDRTNNNVSNLEWCTTSYNNQYREKYGESQGHPVFAINLTTLKVSRFKTQHQASRTLGINQGNINMVIKGKRNQVGGFWFTNDDSDAADTIKQKLYEIKHRSTLKIH